MLNYDYNKLTDIDSSKLYLLRLSDEIKNSSITAQLQRIDTTGNDISIVFSTSLTSNELDELTALVKKS
jgi:DNA polymerase/3'-5' exonuclease PolX